MRINYPIGKRDEAVWYDICTTCLGLIKLLHGFCTPEDERDGEYYFSLDGKAIDVVELVHKAQMFTDGVTDINYTILDTPEQDWAATITIIDGEITNVLEEAVEV